MESRGDLALYEYLYRCIRHDIAHGKVEPGQKLPSKRALAKQLGVSLITIEAAYDQLVAEGYIRSRERCGYYACDLAPAAKIEEQGNAQFRTATETSANRRREDHVSNPNGPQPISQNEGHPESSTGYRPTINPAALPSDAGFVPTIDDPIAPRTQNAPLDAPLLADFTHSTLATTMLPYSAWAKAVRRTLSDESAASLAEAASAAGSPELRSAIADHLRQYRGMDVSPDQVVIGAGSQTAIPAASAAAGAHQALRGGGPWISPAHAHVRAARRAGCAYRAGRFRHRHNRIGKLRGVGRPHHAVAPVPHRDRHYGSPTPRAFELGPRGRPLPHRGRLRLGVPHGRAAHPLAVRHRRRRTRAVPQLVRQKPGRGVSHGVPGAATAAGAALPRTAGLLREHRQPARPAGIGSLHRAGALRPPREPPAHPRAQNAGCPGQRLARSLRPPYCVRRAQRRPAFHHAAGK